MKYFQKNHLMIYIITVLFYALRLACSSFAENIFLNLWIPLFWAAIFIYFKSNYPFENRSHLRESHKQLINIIITLSAFFVINLLLGIFVNFGKSPYPPSAIFMNLWRYGFYIFFQEYARFIFVRRIRRRSFNIVWIILLFIFIQMDPGNLIGSLSFEKIPKYLLYIFLPIVIENLLLTYLAKKYSSGYILTSVYRVYMVLYLYGAPFYPNISASASLILNILLMIYVFFRCRGINETLSPKILYNKKHQRKINYFITIMNLCLFSAIILFISGVTRYIPLVIVSASMEPQIQIGDAVVVERLSPHEISSTIKEGDIIAFKIKDYVVVHRVIKVITADINNGTYYITKGDTNSSSDNDRVYVDKVIGIARYRVPYIGYPSLIVKTYFAH